LFVPAERALFLASASAVSSFVLDASFLDSCATSASFAFTRLLISRLSPVSGMFSPSESISLRASMIPVERVRAKPAGLRSFSFDPRASGWLINSDQYCRRGSPILWESKRAQYAHLSGSSITQQGLRNSTNQS
jgi:hypothetical protein